MVKEGKIPSNESETKPINAEIKIIVRNKDTDDELEDEEQEEEDDEEINYKKYKKVTKVSDTGTARRSSPKPTITKDDEEISDNEYDLQDSDPSIDNATEDEIQINIEIKNHHKEISVPTQSYNTRIGAHFKPQRRGGSFNPPSNTKTNTRHYAHDALPPQDHTLKIGRFRSNSDPTMSPTQAQLQQIDQYQQLNIMNPNLNRNQNQNLNASFTNNR